MMKRIRLALICDIVFVYAVGLCNSEAMTIKFSSRDELSCGKNWTMFRDEKCFIILERVGLLNYKEAERACLALTDDLAKEIPRLLTVKSEEEQDFVNNYLFTGENEVVDHVWLGLTKNEKTGLFDWNDGAELMLTNWAQRSLSESNLTCTQMESGETAFGVGQWVKVSCKKRNVVVCEKIITWPLDRVQNTMLSVKRQLATSVIRQEEVNKDMSDLKKYHALMDAKMGNILGKQEAGEEMLKNFKLNFEFLEQKLNAMSQRNEVIDEQMNLLKQINEVNDQNFAAVKKELQDSRDEFSRLSDKYEAVENQIVTLTEKIEIIEDHVVDLEKKEHKDNNNVDEKRNEEDSKIINPKQIPVMDGTPISNLAAKVATVEEKNYDLKHKPLLAVENFDYFKNEFNKEMNSLKQAILPTMQQGSPVLGKNISDVLNQMTNNHPGMSNVLGDTKFNLLLQGTEQKLNAMKHSLELRVTFLEQRVRVLEQTNTVKLNFQENLNPNLPFVNNTGKSQASSMNVHLHAESSWTQKHGNAEPNGSSSVRLELGKQLGLPENVIHQTNISSAPTTAASKDKPATSDTEQEDESIENAKLNEALGKIESLEQSQKKLEQILKTLLQNIEAKFLTSTKAKDEVTEDMLDTLKQELEEVIEHIKQDLELKITVLEQRSDVSEQLFSVLRRDTIMKIGALEQRLSSLEKGGKHSPIPEGIAEGLPQGTQTHETRTEHNEVKKRREVFMDEDENNLCCSIPVGFTYLQFPGEPDPITLWPLVNWTDISKEYAGLFFRALGGGSAPFGEVQEEGSPHLEFRNNLKHTDDSNKSNSTFGNWSTEVYTGNTKLGGSKLISLRFRFTKQEVRSRNTAIKIWKRLKGKSDDTNINSSSSSSTVSRIITTSVVKN